jgi:hypothetical protein
MIYSSFYAFHENAMKNSASAGHESQKELINIRRLSTIH